MSSGYKPTSNVWPIYLVVKLQQIKVERCVQALKMQD